MRMKAPFLMIEVISPRMSLLMLMDKAAGVAAPFLHYLLETLGVAISRAKGAVTPLDQSISLGGRIRAHIPPHNATRSI